VSHRAWLCWFVALGILMLAIFEAAGVAAAGISVAAVNYEFKPPSRTVHVGDTVVWTMSGDVHTVTSGTVGTDGRGHTSAGPLHSGLTNSGGSYSYTFTKAGTYPYFCEIHADSQMKGTITVVAAAATPKPAPKPTPRVTPRPTPAPTPGPTPTLHHRSRRSLPCRPPASRRSPTWRPWLPAAASRPPPMLPRLSRPGSCSQSRSWAPSWCAPGGTPDGGCRDRHAGCSGPVQATFLTPESQPGGDDGATSEAITRRWASRERARRQQVRSFAWSSGCSGQQRQAVVKSCVRRRPPSALRRSRTTARVTPKLVRQAEPSMR
jgi:plastocyanin